MEVLPPESSNSGDGLKDVEKPTVKMNGDMNGSVEGMEVDEDSREDDGVASDESVCGSSNRVENVGEGTEEDEEEEESDGENKEASEGKSHPNSDTEGRSETKSRFGSEYDAKETNRAEGMDVDGLEEGEGDSVNSEDEDNLLNSENEEEPQTQNATEENGEETEEEEEGDINGGSNGNNDEEKEGSKDGEADGADEETEEEDGESTKDGEGEKTKENGGEVTPVKKKKKVEEANLTPRRSSRTVQKPVRFGQELMDSEDEQGDIEGEDSDGIEEVTPTDPLADPLIDKENRRYPRMIGNTTIVVSDAKRLADIAAQRNAAQAKKEPTLVIIDTNSILSGRGGVPMQTQGGVTITQTSSLGNRPYQSPQPNYPPKPKPPQILPTLTDDMYVVEAPSFIVPYVYEKPPVKKFKKYLRKMLKQVRKQEEEKQQQKEKKSEEEKKEVKAEDDVKKDEAPSEEKDKETKTDAEKDDVDNKMEVDEPKVDESKAKDDSEVSELKKDSSEVDSGDDEQKEKKEAAVASEKSEEPKKEDQEKSDEKPKEESSDSESDSADEEEDKKKQPGTGSYFANPLGKFFMQIGMNLVQEFVQTDLLKQQKKKQKLGKGTEETQAAIASLKKNLMLSRENNEPYTMEQTKCEFCSFKTESKLIMAHHLETPHMRNYVYRCNFCPLEVRGPHDILLHMEAEHCVRGRLERAPAFHQCPQCPFEDNQKGKLTRHLLTCAKKFRSEKNLEPPLDWEPPAKIPRVPRKTTNMPLNVNNPLYHQAMAAKNMPHNLLPKMAPGMGQSPTSMLRPRGRPPYAPTTPGASPKLMGRAPGIPPQLTRGNVLYRPPANTPPVILPATYAGNQLFQVMGPQGQMMNLPGAPPALQRLGVPPQSQQKNPATVKLLNQPSISITPLPRQAPANPQAGVPPTRHSSPSTSKSSFVICEICDGYIKDLEQLRNHMQWIHKVKIHPKMIYNRPPLNCQKCQFRFFTDQGLERHLLGSHGLVTSSMQDSANKGKDGGRCPVCGRVYQWKLLNHVARDHNMTLKPAHLSYKCTVCTATFGMYKQFESHVYSAHSVVAKRVMDKKNGQAPQAPRTPADTASLLKPLKINDEITIIPQPAKKAAQPPQQQAQRPVPGNFRATVGPKARGPDSVQVIDLEDSPNKGAENGAESLTAVKERLRRRKSLEIRQLESEADGSESEEGDTSQQPATNDAEEDGDEEDEDDGQETDEQDQESDG